MRARGIPEMSVWRIGPEQHPKGESHLEGYIEQAGKTTKGMIRVMEAQILYNANVEVAPDDVAMQWLR